MFALLLQLPWSAVHASLLAVTATLQLVQSPSCRHHANCLPLSGAVLVSSVQDGIYALGKAHMRSTPSLRSFPNVAFETVPMFVRLTMALSRPFKEDRLALPH